MLLKIVFFLHSIFYRLSFSFFFSLRLKSSADFSFCTTFPYLLGAVISRSDLQTWTPTFELWWPWIFLIPFDGTKNLNVWRDRKRFACIDFFLKIFFYSQLFHFRFHSVHRKKATRDSHTKNYTNCSREKKIILSSTLRSESERNYRNLVN